YDESRGVSFPSYAVPTITGELKRYFRDNVWAAHVPRGLRERALEVNRAIRKESELTGRTPSPRELAERLKLDKQDALDAIEASLAFDAVSLDTPAGADQDHEQQPRIETIGSIDPGYELADDRVTITAELRKP